MADPPADRHERRPLHARCGARAGPAAERRGGRGDPGRATASSFASCCRSDGRCPRQWSSSPSCASAGAARYCTSGRRPEIDASLEALGFRERSWSSAATFGARSLSPTVLACAGAARRRVRGVLRRRRCCLGFARRTPGRMLSVGLLRGGYGKDELPAPAPSASIGTSELRESLDELGLLS